MERLIFITGGARSGKSSFAVKLATRLSKKVIFIATAQALDKEMKARIKKHQRQRRRNWRTVEEPRDTDKILSELRKRDNLVLLDCLTLLISNWLLSGKKAVFKDVRSLLGAAREREFPTIIVSNEVGMGIVPDSELGRRFRDIAGRVNQMVAKEADEVYLLVSGLPIKIK
ncbi:bifunctional adenosylcobinamide kinase/adenosylcobinamide-phosphate guanylyltransferase [candidate division NPL-UPA2 bacterium]|nr:bifunctional adenosylcobinamide kinase/adenosylcobinamide-phosphate guanylyltransferase [candidate division NPL-UPA2 bacterium]